MTNAAGAVTDTYSYDAFGALRSHAGSSANYFQFTGEQSDVVLNPTDSLYYLRARYYDTTTGRFMSRDPVMGQQTQPQTWNQYAYALNNPATKVDPTGMSSELIGIPRSCMNLLIGLALTALAPGLLFTPAAPLLLPLQIMYVYTAVFVTATQVLEAFQEASTTGQAVSSLDLATEITQALGQSQGSGLLAGIPGLAFDFIGCVRAA